ncbi:MAG: putative epoxide hydrolase [Myxococcaceae bacterium]|nr:putative epoxide hydrolase [Myxococcaceae bacterium]
MPKTMARGVEIFHEETGSGRPLVLLHGLNDSHRSWRAVVPALAQTRRVLVPDLPGCGLSGRPDASYSLDWQAHVMSAWLDAMGLDDVDVVGHSYGGGLAQYMLLVRPQRIRRLALVASGGLGREVSLELRLASFSKVVEMFGQPFMAPIAASALRAVGGVVSADEEVWMTEVNATPGTARAFARTVADVIDWRGQTRHFLDRAAEIEKFPAVALFWGNRDRVIPHAQALSTLKVLRGAELTTFADCGHFPHQQKPAEFADALLSFMDAAVVREVHFVPPTPAPALPWHARAAFALRRAIGAADTSQVRAF